MNTFTPNWQITDEKSLYADRMIFLSNKIMAENKNPS